MCMYVCMYVCVRSYVCVSTEYIVLGYTGN